MQLNAYDKAAIKNAAKAVTHYAAKKETLLKKQLDLQKEIEGIDKEIDDYSKAVIEKTGHAPLELVRKEGNSWVFIYPDTIIPPTDETKEPEAEQEHQPEKEPKNDPEPEEPKNPETETPKDEVKEHKDNEGKESGDEYDDLPPVDENPEIPEVPEEAAAPAKQQPIAPKAFGGEEFPI